jgi:hypothetical protein
MPDRLNSIPVRNSLDLQLGQARRLSVIAIGPNSLDSSLRMDAPHP